MLNAVALGKYDSNYWLTFNQAAGLKGNVKKGEKGTPVIFWKFLEIEKDGEKDHIPLLRYYTVFNVLQCEGIDYPRPEAVTEFKAIDNAESLIKGFINPPKIQHSITGGAFYSPSQDLINLPNRELFNSPPEYYCTAFHEMTHSTGHESRLDRFDKNSPARFGGQDYSKEELIAELGAAMLCGISGISVTLENSAAYIQSWLKALKDDKTLIVYASGKAQKAADHIRNIKPYEKDENE
jgi:antirestriction protein ArdC